MSTHRVSADDESSASVHPSGSAEELSQLISRSFIWMEALDRRALGTVAPPLTTSQYHALVALAREPDPSLAELAARLLTVKSNASGIVDRLEGLGLIQRHQNQVDARRIRLGLTPAGMATLRHAHDARRATLSRAFPDREAKYILALTDLLRDLVDVLRRAVEQQRFSASTNAANDLTCERSGLCSNPQSQ